MTYGPVDWTKYSNQQKLDYIVGLLQNGGPDTLYGASLQSLIDDVPRRAGLAVKPLTDALTAQVSALTAQVTALANAQKALPAATLNQSFTLADGTVTNLAGILDRINAKPLATVTAAPVDVDALAAKLSPALPPAVVSALAAKLSQP